MNLSERLQGVVDILNASNSELASPKSDATGFIAVPPERLAKAVLLLLEHVDTTNISLDMGCGNGGWLLLAAAAGYPSHGIEISPFLLDHCQRNYDLAIAAGFIDPATPCSFTIGDMIPSHFSKRYDEFRKQHPGSMPVGAIVEDSYSRLPVSPATADIIYVWAWPTQSRFVYNMLRDEAKASALFVLPCYEQYVQKEGAFANTLRISPIAETDEITIGVSKQL